MWRPGEYPQRPSNTLKQCKSQSPILQNTELAWPRPVKGLTTFLGTGSQKSLWKQTAALGCVAGAQASSAQTIAWWRLILTQAAFVISKLRTPRKGETFPFSPLFYTPLKPSSEAATSSPLESFTPRRMKAHFI